MVDNNLKLLAKNARNWTETIASNTSNTSLCGYCAIGSSYLFILSKKYGYNDCKIIVNKDNSHCFNYFSSINYIVDITSTQFAIKKKIYIRRTFKDVWEKGEEFNSIKDFIDFQKNTRWSTNQMLDAYLDMIEPHLLQKFFK